MEYMADMRSAGAGADLRERNLLLQVQSIVQLLHLDRPLLVSLLGTPLQGLRRNISICCPIQHAHSCHSRCRKQDNL